VTEREWSITRKASRGVKQFERRKSGEGTQSYLSKYAKYLKVASFEFEVARTSGAG